MAGWREPRAVRPRRVNDESRSDGWSSNTTRLECLIAWCLEVIHNYDYAGLCLAGIFLVVVVLWWSFRCLQPPTRRRGEVKTKT